MYGNFIGSQEYIGLCEHCDEYLFKNYFIVESLSLFNFDRVIKTGNIIFGRKIKEIKDK